MLNMAEIAFNLRMGSRRFEISSDTEPLILLIPRALIFLGPSNSRGHVNLCIHPDYLGTLCVVEFYKHWPGEMANNEPCTLIYGTYSTTW